MHGRKLALESDLHGVRFAGIRHGIDDAAALHDLAHAHGYRPLRHVIQSREPAFAELLFPTHLIQIHHKIRSFRIEVGGRIVERDMSVFADADERNIDRLFLQMGPEPVAETPEIFRFPVHQIHFLHRHGQFADEAFRQILPKTGRMGDGKSDILVEMEHGYFAPVDPRFLQQSGKHFELTRSGGQDHAAFALLRNGLTDLPGSEFRGFRAAFLFVPADHEIHFSNS